MWRTPWLNGLVLGLTGALTGIGNGLAIAGPSSSDLTQQIDGNGVTVIATLLKEQVDTTAITLALDSYFVNLVRYDFEELAILRDDTGKTYSVTSVEWIGSSLKPHFRQAVLRFPRVAPEAKTIELVVKDVAGVQERVFRWTLTESQPVDPGCRPKGMEDFRWVRSFRITVCGLP